MKRIVGVLSVVAAIALAAGPGLCEKQIVKLEHKVFKTRKEAQQFGSHGMHGAMLRGDDSAKQEVEWPKFQCATPLYGGMYLRVPDENNPGQDRAVSIAVALDQSGATEDTYDTLYIDLDRDGKFSKRERRVGRKAPPSQFEQGETIDFGTIAVPTGRPEHPVEHFAMTGQKYPGDAGYLLLYSPVCYLEGTINTESGPSVIRLFDSSINGSFADYGQDQISFSQHISVPLSRVACIGEEFVDIEVAADAGSIIISPYEGETGKLSFNIKTKSGTVQLVSGQITNGTIVLPAGPQIPGDIQLPVGDYSQTQLSINCQEEGTTWGAFSSGYAIHIEADETTALTAGHPLRMETALAGSTAPGETVEVDYSIKGASDEIYRSIYHYDGDGRYASSTPKAVVKNAMGEFVADAALAPG